MFLLVIALILFGAIAVAYLVDRHDRKNGHPIGSGPEFRARIRAAKKQSRDRIWGRNSFGPTSRRARNDDSDRPRGRRTH